MPGATLRNTPRWLLAACALFFLSALFVTRFPDVPGAAVGSYASTVLIALPSFLALWRYLGPRTAAASLLALSLFGYAIETTGVATGFPYGPFFYGDALGPKLFGLVPFILPVSWAPLVLGAVAATAPLRGTGSRSTLAVWVCAATLLLVLVDGVLDPGAAALGFWVWPQGGAYYGVPLSNYLGWVLSSAVASAVLLALGRGRWGKAAPPPGLLDSLLMALAFWTGVAAFSGLLFPALLGLALFAQILRRRSRLAAHNTAR